MSREELQRSIETQLKMFRDNDKQRVMITDDRYDLLLKSFQKYVAQTETLSQYAIVVADDLEQKEEDMKQAREILKQSLTEEVKQELISGEKQKPFHLQVFQLFEFSHLIEQQELQQLFLAYGNHHLNLTVDQCMALYAENRSHMRVTLLFVIVLSFF